jgi:2-phosphoglycolate phosphatase
MPLTAALFDFDGTLADSFGAITASTNHVRQSYGLSAMSEAEVRGHVGWGLDNLISRLVPGAAVEEAVGRYREHHAGIMLTQTRLMPEVEATIRALAARGVKLAVCSNKRVEFTRELVTALGLGDCFPHVLGPDDVGDRAKPDPAMLLEGLYRLKVSPAEAVYVGDMVIDVRTARAAGVAVWLVPTGTTEPGEEPDRRLASFSEILRLM